MPKQSEVNRLIGFHLRNCVRLQFLPVPPQSTVLRFLVPTSILSAIHELRLNELTAVEKKLYLRKSKNIVTVCPEVQGGIAGIRILEYC